MGEGHDDVVVVTEALLHRVVKNVGKIVAVKQMVTVPLAVADVSDEPDGVLRELDVKDDEGVALSEPEGLGDAEMDGVAE